MTVSTHWPWGTPARDTCKPSGMSYPLFRHILTETPSSGTWMDPSVLRHDRAGRLCFPSHENAAARVQALGRWSGGWMTTFALKCNKANYTCLTKTSMIELLWSSVENPSQRSAECVVCVVCTVTGKTFAFFFISCRAGEHLRHLQASYVTAYICSLVTEKTHFR